MQRLRVITPQNLILKTIEESSEPLTPMQVYKQIMNMTHIKYPTVKSYLRRLYQRELILQPYPSYYCSNILYGMIKGQVVVHCVFFSVDAPFLRRFAKIGDITEFTGGVKLFLQFGKQRRNLSGKISCDVPGMSKDTLLFAINRVLDLMEHATSHVVDVGITLTSFETNKDYPGKRLDGKITCLTKKQLFEVIERVYQKDEDTVRLERKISCDLKVEEAVALLKREIPDNNVAAGLFVLKQCVEGLTTSQKFNNREVVGLRDDLKKLVDALNGKNGEKGVPVPEVVLGDPKYIS